MPTRISYDGMSRLTAAGYLENGKRNNHFSTSYKYDLMGNILSLRREGLLNSGNYVTIDDNGIVMHFYVKDHLGSNRLVVDGNGNIEEVNHYYPFGALMGDRCGVSRNNYKYIGKELDTMYGWNMQDHEARWYDPVVGRWIVTDPLQGKYASVSPYCYVISNPIKFIDPEGNEWEDPDQAEKLKAKIDNKITSIQNSILAQKARLESKCAKGKDFSKQERKIADFESRISKLNQSKYDIDLLSHDSQIYKLTPVTGEGAHKVRREKNGTISIETSEEALSIHEITHVRQALEAGGLEFSDSGFLKNPGTRAKSSERYFAISEAEIEAYKMQYSYRPESLPISVANISIIDVHYVGSIKDPNGGYGYPMIKDYSDFLKSQQKLKNK